MSNVNFILKLKNKTSDINQTFALSTVCGYIFILKIIQPFIQIKLLYFILLYYYIYCLWTKNKCRSLSFCGKTICEYIQQYIFTKHQYCML